MLFVVFADGSCYSYSRMDRVPPGAVLVNAKSEAAAKLDGLSKIKNVPICTEHKPGQEAAAIVLETLPPRPKPGITAAQPITIQQASRQLLSFLETTLDLARGGGKFIRVSREKMSEAFTLCDWITTQLEDKNE